MQFKKILVPIDGSGTADNAFHYGLEMAETYQADLYAVVVADVGEAAYPLMQVNLDRNGFASVKEKAEAVMERIKKQVPPDIHFTPVIRVGVPGNVITSLVEEENIDLVIMGNSGKGSLSSFIMGSVSQYVIHHVKVPVLIIK
ncbi:universal stress protein [Dialister sp.]|uniref:universal stress protein n=1 Tax=Dialister sp. TaxID=1955814 RepID=UPI003F100299